MAGRIWSGLGQIGIVNSNTLPRFFLCGDKFLVARMNLIGIVGGTCFKMDVQTYVKGLVHLSCEVGNMSSDTKADYSGMISEVRVTGIDQGTNLVRPIVFKRKIDGVN